MDRLAGKYKVIQGKMGEGEDGEGRSQAYYVIKAAQERDELQRQVHLCFSIYLSIYLFISVSISIYRSLYLYIYIEREGPAT